MPPRDRGHAAAARVLTGAHCALAPVLASAGFAETYYALCERYPPGPKRRGVSATKYDVIDALRAAGARYTYDCRDRSFRIDPKLIDGIQRSGLFVKRQGGSLDLVLLGESPDSPAFTGGGSFALLAEQVLVARGGEAPPRVRYPRPCYNGNPHLLRAIAADFVALYRRCVAALEVNPIRPGAALPPTYHAPPFGWSSPR